MTPTVTVVSDCPRCAGRLYFRQGVVRAGSEGVGVVECGGCDRTYALTVYLREIPSPERSYETIRKQEFRDRTRV